MKKAFRVIQKVRSLSKVKEGGRGGGGEGGSLKSEQKRTGEGGS